MFCCFVPLTKTDCCRSEVLKEHVDQQRKTEHLDRAVLAFKVGQKVSLWDKNNSSLCLQAIDKDNSGFITTAELGKMSQAMSKKKCEALMKKLDTDGDGKITLVQTEEQNIVKYFIKILIQEEFRALFAEA